jgi:hypothetical protein
MKATRKPPATTIPMMIKKIIALISVLRFLFTISDANILNSFYKNVGMSNLEIFHIRKAGKN